MASKVYIAVICIFLCSVICTLDGCPPRRRKNHHVINEKQRTNMPHDMKLYEDLLIVVRKTNLRLYGHTTRPTEFAKIILKNNVQGSRRRGRQGKKEQDIMMERILLKLRETSLEGQQ
ncbi:hypothetical protein PoB_001960500 [Plakobranchus ocellatus]|uniref:Uncharacterized protein n=1 Tax=Plakobranchus ocellatus TaxID=259542 RepID=A0AAV3ZET1_9GAST|nr:hypothetical protein PoB_001960500 [Plakobranchus ocellatus]